MHLYRGQEIGTDELGKSLQGDSKSSCSWDGPSEEDPSSLQLLEDFSSFRSDMKFKQKSSAITLHMTSVSMYLLSASTSLSYFIILLFSHSAVSGSFTTPWTAARQASLSFTISQSLFKLMSIESVTPPNHLTLCHPLLLPPSIFPSIRVFADELALCIRWPKF